MLKLSKQYFVSTFTVKLSSRLKIKFKKDYQQALSFDFVNT